MIAYLSGKLVFSSPATVMIEVQGIGYEVHISLHTFSAIQGKETVLLHTYQQFREDGQTLYGFFEKREKDMFIMLIGINGIGAGTARMILSAMRPAEITDAILNGHASALEKIKGIGKKTAERMVLELRDKLSKPGGAPPISPFINNTLEQDALNALMALGIPRPAAEKAVSKALVSGPDDLNLELLIKKSLQII